MEIPHSELTPETLRNLIEEFVSREGTDYGHNEYSLDEKVSKVLRQLETGRVQIVYDAEEQSCHIVVKE